MPYRWTYSTRVIPGQISRAQWRNTLMYKINSDIQVGVEYNPLANDVGPLMNWRVLREGAGQPAIIIGTSSDRIGTPSGRAFYVTFSKSVSDGIGLYVGASYSQYEDKVLIPAGASFRLSDDWNALLVFDGVKFHPMVTYSWERYSVTLLLAELKQPGINFTVGF